MLKEEKVAIARIFSDLIKADRIIDTGEMYCWDRFCSKYGIDKEMECEAQQMTFAGALEIICSSDTSNLKGNLLDDCRDMTVSDGFCAHSEALIMMALMLVLDPEVEANAEVISIPKADFNIDIATALYIESYYDDTTNEAIRNNYRILFKEFQLAGFHFVYLPSVIDHYRNTDRTLFRRILSYLAPSLSDAGLDATYKSVLGTTTDSFCKDLLCNRCGISQLRNTYPSLLIKIGSSFVGESSYSNYLKVEVGDDIVSCVQSFVDSFCSMLSSDVYVVRTSEERDNQFHFHGFYKQLLDICLIRKNIRSSIVIDPYKEEIYFPEIDAKATGLHRREKALYALLLCQGAAGLNFNRPSTQAERERYDRRMRQIQKRYSAIYSMFGGDAPSAPDLSVPEIRRPIFSSLRRSLRKLTALYNPQDYNVDKNSDGIFAVHIEPALVFVSQLDGSDPIPMAKSELYERGMRL